MSAKYLVDYKDIELLEERMSRLPNVMEGVVNKVLHSDGIRIATEEVTRLIPVATKPGRLPHARHVDWSKSEEDNLGFTVKSKGGAASNKYSYGYLVFPDEGRGSSNPVAQEFLDSGLNNAVPKIITRVLVDVDKKLKEEL